MPELERVDPSAVMEQVLIKGDLSKLSEAERVDFYNATCRSLGLNPLTQPFEYLYLNGKLKLYAKKDATDQLRRIYGVSIVKCEHFWDDEMFHTTAYARLPDGREDVDCGVVHIGEQVKGDIRGNLILKGITKAKRRVTLSICGLGFLDETEVEDIPQAAMLPPRPELGGANTYAPAESATMGDLFCRAFRKCKDEPALYNYKEDLKKNGYFNALQGVDQKRVMDCYRACAKELQKKAKEAVNDQTDNGVPAGK